MQDMCSTSLWVRFFTESGIPHSVAANYGVTFVENRITKNMLLDLNKEILQDMGIAVMGDVIAILKHAKVVHAQMTREKVYQNEPSVASVFPVAQPRRSTMVRTRILPDSIQTTADSPSSSFNPESPAISASMTRPMTQGIMSNLHQPTASVSAVSPALKRTASQRVIASSQNETQAKKARRVLPEHEGPYKISMPSGTTSKTRKLLAQLVSKESVFERLGEDSTGATKQVAKTPTLAKRRKAKTTPTPTGSSVFQRLGPGKGDAESELATPSPQPVNQAKKRVVLQPAKKTLPTSVKPILKKRLGPKVSAAPIAKSTMVAAVRLVSKTVKTSPNVRFTQTTAVHQATSSQGILAKRNLSSTTTNSIYSRLGDKAIVQTANLQKKLAAATLPRTVTTTAKRTGVEAPPGIAKVIGLRAGLPRITIVSSASGRSSVFGRLGPPAVD